MLTATIVDEAQQSTHFSNFKKHPGIYRILNPQKHKNVDPYLPKYKGTMQTMRNANAPYFSERSHFPYVVPENNVATKFKHKHADGNIVDYHLYGHLPTHIDGVVFHPTGVSEESVAAQIAPTHGFSGLNALQ